MSNLDRKALWTKWLIIVWLAILIPLPYCSPELKGTAPLLLLMLIAIGGTAGPAVFMPIEVAAFASGYSVLLYWIASRLSCLLLASGGRSKQIILLAAAGLSLIVVLSPIYIVVGKTVKFHNLYSFVKRELFIAGATGYDRTPKLPTRDELLALPDTIIYEDIAITFTDPPRITRERDERIKEIEKLEGIRVARPGLAWWLRVKFIPMQETLRGIPSAHIFPTWRKVSEQRRGVIPNYLLKGEWIGRLAGGDAWDPDFSVMGDFNGDGIEDIALVGVYEDQSGELGNFFLILTKNADGRWAKVHLSIHPGDLGPIGLSWDSREIHIAYCTNCDSSADVRWDNQTSTYTHKNQTLNTAD